MIENPTGRRTWGVTEEQRKADVLAELWRLKHAGVPLSVRSVGGGTYTAARKAFGSWSAALEAMGEAPRITKKKDAYALMRDMDVVSPWPVEGLPDFMRERQILGGRMLEILAEEVCKSPSVERGVWFYSDTMLADALERALKEEESR